MGQWKTAFDLKGQKFGRWTVLEKAPTLKDGNSRWLCQCECGTQKIVMEKNLRNGRSKSCGCLKDEKSKERITQLNKNKTLNL